MGIILFSAPIFAQNLPNECSKELLLAYFPEVIVAETLKKFDIPEDQRSGIEKDLSSKDKEVIKLVEEKAQKISPNPLKDTKDRKAAIELFKGTLLEVFSEVMHAHGITNDEKIQAMLEDVKQRKAEQFAKCHNKSKEE